MKNGTSLVLLLFFLSSCKLVAGIFKAGFMSGVILVVAIIVLVVLLMNRSNKKE